MTIDRLREALSAIGPPPDARELSEMLWLACHISPAPGERSASAPPEPSGACATPPEPALPPAPARAAPEPEPPAGLHPRPAPGAEPAGEAAQVLVPTAPMLADALGVQRALRPLKRRVPSRHRRELDEEATAARIADTRLWTPVLVPAPERWLTLSLVVDTGPTMRLWRPLARELAETLARQGAFRDVHLTYLDTGGRIASAPDAPGRAPGTLLDASGRHAVLVLSDCSGPHWWDGRAAGAVRRWAQAGPVAILQPLAERLWRRTAAPAAPGLAVLPRPGAPNTGLRFTPHDGAVPPGVPVPVLEVAPRWFAAWARLVSGADPQPAAITALPPRPAGPAPLHRERELPIAERVRRFLTTASPGAAELAAHVAVSVPSLPVMRLIQHRILGGSGPGRLAEVLLSGLLRPIDDVRYEFVPGAREALLDTLPRPEAQHTRHVLKAVSAEIERRAGTAAETFRALLPADGGPVTLTADTDHFALLTPRTRAHLAPAPGTGPDLLRLLGVPADDPLSGWDGPPRATVLGVDHGDPVTLNVLDGEAALPHGLIVGPRAARDALLRTTVFGLALTHSPGTVNFVFADFSRGASFVGLGNLPHVAAAVHAGSADSPQLSYLIAALEDERIRRDTVLDDTDLATWDEYRRAVAGGASHEPLPALVVVLDNTGPLLDARPDLLDPLVWLCETGGPLGIRFLFCTPDGSPPPGPLLGHIGWNTGSRGDDGAFLHIFADRAHPHFEPARVPLDVTDPLIEQMRRRGPSARKLPWPEEHPVPAPGASASPAVPEFDVLKLNGAEPSAMFHETWALPASEPRNPAIGHAADGGVLTLSPLDFSSGIPHGLIVGAPEARHRVVRAITLALAAGHSPATLTFAFAGLGDHPLGEPLDLPHVRYSEHMLLARPRKLHQFLDFLSDELDSRAAAAPRDLPRTPDFGTNQWLVDELYERYREDPDSVDRAWGDFFADYPPGDRPSPAPPAPAPEAPPRLLIVADVSLTLPPGRPEVGEALLSLAQRGRALGVQLLLTSTTVEHTTIWDRFLPLLGWRIAAGPLPPAELQRVLGRASLPFPCDRTAYLLAGGGPPRRFTVAPAPSTGALNTFLDRVHNRPPESAEEPRLRFLSEVVEALGTADALSIQPMFRELLMRDADALMAGRLPRHLILTGRQGPDVEVPAAVAAVYGRLLSRLGILSHGDVSKISWSAIGGYLRDTTESLSELFRTFRGGVILLHHAGEAEAPGYLRPEAVQALIAATGEHPDDPLVILCGDSAQADAVRVAVPRFDERFTVVDWIDDPHGLPDMVHLSALPPVADGRIPIGIQSGTPEPVFVDFDADPHLLVAGQLGSGRANLLHLLLKGIAARAGGRETQIHVLDPHGLLRSIAHEFGLPEPVEPGVGYTGSPEEFFLLVAGIAERPPDGEVYLVVIDLPPDSFSLRTVLTDLLSVRGGRVHVVVARLATSAGMPHDPLVRALHTIGAPAVLLGTGQSREAELYGAELPTGFVPPGRGVLVRSGRQRDIQVAHASPDV
ncbi:SAV_2336 N-terminal domain-related protein [Actinomadura formosensis]|uniref:SAV_2336 N-terminal domain-related protein n=1 Tax=Actinomadura formosensis TaxID=60706 RepID=UPI000829737B|nr:SAV_2336 N-terminal domain-related protein [Actinomadura formosensis]